MLFIRVIADLSNPLGSAAILRQPRVLSVTNIIFLALAYKDGRPVLSLSISSSHRQCTVSALIIAELAKWNRNLITGFCPLGDLNFQPPHWQSSKLAATQSSFPWGASPTTIQLPHVVHLRSQSSSPMGCAFNSTVTSQRCFRPDSTKPMLLHLDKAMCFCSGEWTVPSED